MSTPTEPQPDGLFDEPCSFSADDFVAIYDRLLDRLAGMHLPDGMGLREAIDTGFVTMGANEDAIAAEGVTPAVRETVAKVAELTTSAEGGTVSFNALATALGRDKSAVGRRVKTALRGGYLRNDETGPGKPHKLRLGDPLPQERAALPAPDTVFPPPTATPATVQHPAENPQNDAGNGTCPGDADPRQQRTGSEPGVAGLAPVLHRPVQQAFPQNDAENGPIEAGCFPVALGEPGTGFDDVGEAGIL